MNPMASTGAGPPARTSRPGPLTADQRTVMVLVDSAGLPTDEVASALDLPPGVVRSHLAAARRALRTRSPAAATTGPRGPA